MAIGHLLWASRPGCGAMLAVMLLVLPGCGGFGIPLHEATDAVAHQGQQSGTIRAGEATRSQVRSALGAPWLQSDYWRVDVYRIDEKRQELTFFASLVTPPVPVGVFSVEESGYALVAYDEGGRVAAIAFGSASKLLGDKEDLTLRTQDLSLGIETLDERGAHLMAAASRLPGYLALQRRSPQCTLVVACDQIPFEKWPDEGCPNRVTIDAGAPLNPQPLVQQCAGKSCPGGAVRYSGSAFAHIPLLYAVTLPPGRHQVETASSTFQGRSVTTVECAAGQVQYAVIRGRVDWHWWSPRSSTLDASVTLSDTQPQAWSNYNVVLALDGQWLVAREPATR